MRPGQKAGDASNMAEVDKEHEGFTERIYTNTGNWSELVKVHRTPVTTTKASREKYNYITPVPRFMQIIYSTHLFFTLKKTV